MIFFRQVVSDFFYILYLSVVEVEPDFCAEVPDSYVCSIIRLRNEIGKLFLVIGEKFGG